MNKMRAFVRTNPENNHVELALVDIPKIGPNEVLVKVEAFGVGIHDRYFIPREAEFPYPIGIEGAGMIEKRGKNIEGLQLGDRVVFSSSLLAKGGCWAEYVAVSDKLLVPIPDELDITHGAAIPVAGKTALECMRALDLKEGDTLFIAGASGAIGTLVIQLAKIHGIRVIGSASSKNHEYMQSLGAEKTVDYTNSHWKMEVKEWMPNGVDAALAIQPGTGVDSMDIVRNGGKVITVSGDRFAAERNITVEQFQHHLDMQQAISYLIEYIVLEKIGIVIEQVYPFEQALESLEKTETRHARGKRVVLV